jgi:hypothetical protein
MVGSSGCCSLSLVYVFGLIAGVTLGVEKRLSACNPPPTWYDIIGIDRSISSKSNQSLFLLINQNYGHR